MLGSGEMAAREHPDVDAERRESLSRGDNLPRFERVLLAARDVEGNAVVKLAHKRRTYGAARTLWLVFAVMRWGSSSARNGTSSVSSAKLTGPAGLGCGPGSEPGGMRESGQAASPREAER